MKPELVTLIPKADQYKLADQDRLVKFFQDCVIQAKDGKIIGVLALVNTGTEYQHTRIAFTYENAVGMCHRMAHKLMQDWDTKV